MATMIRRSQILNKRTITIDIELISKDASDDALAKKFGDITINPTGKFGDPNDAAYPPFYVYAGEPVPFFTVQSVKAIFVDDVLDILDLQKRAKLWGDAVSEQIQSKLIALRTLTDNSTMSADITI